LQLVEVHPTWPIGSVPSPRGLTSSAQQPEASLQGAAHDLPPERTTTGSVASSLLCKPTIHGIAEKITFEHKSASYPYTMIS